MLTGADKPVRGRRRELDPNPHFKAPKSGEFRLTESSIELQIREDHLARKVLALVGEFDLKEVVGTYSSLGRRGFHPSNLFALWVYASLTGLHESTKLARQLETDAALLFLTGGHSISSRTLREFKSDNAELFWLALVRTIELALERGLIDPKQLATDSVRLRAHASLNAVRTLKRSRERLNELSAVDTGKLDKEARELHEAKVEKHTQAIAECEAAETPNIVKTNPSAGLMKFPYGASAPGHRVTVTSAGSKERIAVGVLIDGTATDDGKLGPALAQARELLTTAGLPGDHKLRATADCGYFTREDLRYAMEHRDSIDILIPEKGGGGDDGIGELPAQGKFGRQHFKILPGEILCPANKAMKGPYPDKHRERWYGVGCDTCSLKPRCCTKGDIRSVLLDHDYNTVTEAMRRRMAEPDGRTLYARRIATIEPVFSHIESVMNYRRVTTRVWRSVLAEILLKLVAHNISRLIRGTPLQLCLVVVTDLILANPSARVGKRGHFPADSHGANKA